MPRIIIDLPYSEDVTEDVITGAESTILESIADTLGMEDSTALTMTVEAGATETPAKGMEEMPEETETETTVGIGIAPKGTEAEEEKLKKALEG